MDSLNLEMFLSFLSKSSKPLRKKLRKMTQKSKMSCWKILFNALVLVQTNIIIVYNRFLLTSYDTIWNVYRKLSTQNPGILSTCGYCGNTKVRVVGDIWGSGIKKIWMYFKNVQYTPANLYVTQSLKSRQVWICHKCIDAMK